MKRSKNGKKTGTGSSKSKITRSRSNGASKPSGSGRTSNSASRQSGSGQKNRTKASAKSPPGRRKSSQSSGWILLGGVWPHRLEQSQSAVSSICYAVLRGAISTLVDFHDGLKTTDADFISIEEVYDDALQWCFSQCGPMTFEYACHAVGIDPIRLRKKLMLLRSRISFKQFIRHQPCARCDSHMSVIGQIDVFLFPICQKCLSGNREDINPERACMVVFRAYHERHRPVFNPRLAVRN